MGTSARLILVWLVLLTLLVLTVAFSFNLTGPSSLIASLTIAFMKACLIFWFYMHLREEAALLRLVAIAAGVWLTIAFVLVFADYAIRAIAW